MGLTTQTNNFEIYNSFWIDQQKTFKNEEIFNKIWDLLKIDCRQGISKYKECVKSVIANLNVAESRKHYIRYSNKAIHYSQMRKEKKADWYTARILTYVIDCFEKAGFIEIIAGYCNSFTGVTKSPMFRPLDTFKELVGVLEYELKPLRDYVRLKNSDGLIVDFTECKESKKAYRIARKWFNLLNEQPITNDDIIPEDVQYLFKGNTLIPTEPKIIYSDNFKKEGRFYSTVCNLPNKNERKVRESLKINGNKTIELDFKSMHPNILLHMEGKQSSSTVYTIPDNHKDLVKIIVLTAINCKDINVLCKAVRKKVSDDGMRFDYKLTDDVILDLFEKWCKEYPMLVEYMNKNMGLKLMFIDGQICLDVLDYFNKKNILCLSIHDSFRIEEKYMKELEEVMKRVYRKHTGCYPIIEVK